MNSKIQCLLFILSISYTLAWSQTDNLEIWQIQGSGVSSPYANQVVTTPENIVTAVANDRFFIQTPANRSDNNSNTSDGIMVLLEAPVNLSPGDIVTITGEVIEANATTAFRSSGLNIDQVNGTASLPTTVILGETYPSVNPSTPAELERVENMLVSVDATICGPSDGDEMAAFFLAEERPFRETGIPFPGQNGLPVWDGNPELIYFDPNGIGEPNNRFLNAGMSLIAEGVLVQENSNYLLLPTAYEVSGDPFGQSVRSRMPGEFTVGTLNVLRLDSENDNYVKQLKKLSAYIVSEMKAPDILAIQEVYDLNDLEDLNFYILQEDPSIDYSLHLIPGFDDINLAFMVRGTVQDVAVSQLGRLEFFSQGGHLHDRPPLLLEANINTTPPTPIKVLNLHLRSMIGIEGSNASFVRNKRNEQAISVSNMVQQFQGEDLIVLGDFNAFQFSDGYVDIYNQIKGGNSQGAQFSVENIVNPTLLDPASFLPTEERYSFVFEGNAGLIDHCLTTDLNGFEVIDYAFARGNTDNAEAYADNAFLVYRASDHDGSVLYLMPENPLISSVGDQEPEAKLQFPNPFQTTTDQIKIVGTQGEYLIRLFNQGGQLLWQQKVASGVHSLPLALPAGTYFLELNEQQRRKTWPLTVIR